MPKSPPPARRALFARASSSRHSNPKTAAFFLAFLPQFVDPAAGPVWLQFVVLGLISVTLNTAVDVVVTFLAARARDAAVRAPACCAACVRAPASPSRRWA
jgi:threonine/homoserine/homoserine lactone efflux protein